jgi:hypothetical protein
MVEENIIYPRASNFNSGQEYFDHILNSREACQERGYHRVNSEPNNRNEVMICYDCDLWFDKEFAEGSGIEYKVESL